MREGRELGLSVVDPPERRVRLMRELGQLGVRERRINAFDLTFEPGELLAQRFQRTLDLFELVAFRGRQSQIYQPSKPCFARSSTLPTA